MESNVPSINNLDGVDQSSETNPASSEATPHKGPGRPEKPFSEADRLKIFRMAGFGIPYTIIAKIVERDPKTLRKHCAKELFEGRLHADEAVLGSLHRMAVSEKCVTATIFWVKTRCTYLSSSLDDQDDIEKSEIETQKRQVSAKAGAVSAPPKVSALLNMIVYDNEGEPNADY
jgi:hypothetical protein